MSSASRYFKTAPSDSRFPTVNQANHCWNLYNEWVLCTKKAEEAGDDAKKCYRKRHNALALCPDEWTEKWDEDRDEGTYAGIK
ncbi:cytochrome c oxidase subunit 6b [Ectocarpus siliculosus]|uniref:Cytochrome c oxidase subunit 6b n=1 Tax=Ectocarpus siliculosus TaxID=2880 RepID=D8LG10_ECTSI|nr:cytochrome c oxidase subunit 6b [Ectocarpus siliculosus]|eukprot:CBN78909.1 cytochrome c oxidase subunit 6b [Ectocarpus siliculosus]